MAIFNAISRLFLLLLLFFHAYAHSAEETSFPPLNYPPELQQQLAKTLQGSTSQVYRTAHLKPDGTPLYSNRLLLADSPYLRQHAHNPVDWHEWSAETWAKAQILDRPIFLSIGYATCHWCHVMEEESFDNLEIASLINEHFIAVKVDREAIPLVDQVYMDAARRLIGFGGWPLNMVLTPERSPYRAGTYFPPRMLLHFLRSASTAYTTTPEGISTQADLLWDEVQRGFQTTQRAARLNPKASTELKAALVEAMDELQGGFGHAPKFPYETRLQFLLEQQIWNDDPELAENLNTTLHSMARGALFDQLAGGFHRYTVDDNWHEPHFEKMLYNQASLINVYRSAWQLEGDPSYKRVIEMTVDYLQRETQDSRGLFYAASDADDAGGEGRYYKWSVDEIKQVLGPEDSQSFFQYYAIAENDSADEFGPLVVREEFDDELPTENQERLRKQLLSARQQRQAPFKDTKIITAWNAQLITAIALASDALSRPDWLLTSQQSLNTLWIETVEKHGTPLPRFLIGDTISDAGGLIDHASLLEALVTLYRLDKNPLWLRRAEQLANALLNDFSDQSTGLIYQTIEDDATGLGFRPLSQGDLDKPEGSATALRAFRLLAAATGGMRWSNTMDQLIATYAERINGSPNNWSEFLTAWEQQRHGDALQTQWAAHGKVHLKLERNPPHSDHPYKLLMHLHRDWHVQSSTPSEADLIATELHDANGQLVSAEVKPGAKWVQTTQNSKPLSLYSGLQRFDFTLNPDSKNITLTLQACDDKTCLAPEKITLQLPRF